jgi:small subunit ribosomal protein S8
VTTPASTLRGRVLDVLKSEGFIRGYSEQTGDSGMAEYAIELKYSDNVPVIRTIERVSRPGRRVYASVRNIPSVANGLGVSILSTPRGVMADHEAKAQNLGGEVLCRVF